MVEEEKSTKILKTGLEDISGDSKVPSPNKITNNNNVDFINKVNDDCLIHIFTKLPVVDRFIIEQVCKRWQRVSSKAWYNLKKLNFSVFFTSDERVNMNKISDKTLERVLIKCGRFLTHFSLNSDDPDCKPNYNVSDKFSVYQLEQIKDITLALLKAYCTQLIYLNISHCPLLTKDGISIIAKITTLKTLLMRNLKCVDGELDGLINLEILDCKCCAYLKDDVICKLMQVAPNLKFLYLYGCSVSSEVLTIANSVTSQRTNNVLLHIIVNKLVKSEWMFTGNPCPLLYIQAKKEYWLMSDSSYESNDDSFWADSVDYNSSDINDYNSPEIDNFSTSGSEVRIAFKNYDWSTSQSDLHSSSSSYTHISLGDDDHNSSVSDSHNSSKDNDLNSFEDYDPNSSVSDVHNSSKNDESTSSESNIPNSPEDSDHNSSEQDEHNSANDNERNSSEDKNHDFFHDHSSSQDGNQNSFHDNDLNSSSDDDDNSSKNDEQNPEHDNHEFSDDLNSAQSDLHNSFNNDDDCTLSSDDDSSTE